MISQADNEQKWTCPLCHNTGEATLFLKTRHFYSSLQLKLKSMLTQSSNTLSWIGWSVHEVKHKINKLIYSTSDVCRWFDFKVIIFVVLGFCRECVIPGSFSTNNAKASAWLLRRFGIFGYHKKVRRWLTLRRLVIVCSLVAPSQSQILLVLIMISCFSQASHPIFHKHTQKSPFMLSPPTYFFYL